MMLQICVARRLGLGVVLSAAAGGAMFLPTAAGAVPEQGFESFALQSKVATLHPESDEEKSPWILHAESEAVDVRQFDSYSPGADSRSRGISEYDSFARFESKHRPRDGGGWVVHGGFGDDRHECDDGCVSTSAVPEPTRVALTFAGLVAVLILVKRQRRAGRALFALR